MCRQCVNKQSQDFACQQERVFITQLSWQWPMNMARVLWCRFQPCLGTFTMLLFERLSKTGLFRHLSNHFYEVRNSVIQKLWGSCFFSEYSKCNIHFKNAEKNSEKFSCFWEKCIWIAVVKLSLLRTGYFSLACIVLSSSPKVLDANNRDFFQLSWIGSSQWIWSMSMIKVLWCRLQQCLGMFTMLLVERLSEAGLLRHLSNYVFGVHNSGNRKALRLLIFFKIFKM